MSNSTCEKCGEPTSNNERLCAKCEGKKFVNGAKSLFGHLFQDVKKLTAKVRKVRIDQ